MNKTFIWVGIVVLAIVGLFMLGKENGAIKPDFEVGVIHPLDNIKGSASSTVVLMEYSDFQCPACRSYYPVLREIMQQYGDRMAFVYRHFPLITIHPNAEFAARAAEAAKKQGKFWEMYDLLFEKQNEWANSSNVAPIFESYATLIGISVEQFKTDWVSADVKNFVRSQRLHSVKVGLQGTPTFYLNGRKIQNPGSIEEFKSLIEAALKG